MLRVIYICIKFNKYNENKEDITTKTNSEVDHETGLLYPDVFYRKVKDYTLLSTEPACLVAFHAENIEQLYWSQDSLEKENNIAAVTNILIPSKQDTFFSAIKSRHEYLVFIQGYDKAKTLDLIDSMHQEIKAALQKLLGAHSLSTVECGYTWYPRQAKTLDDLIINTSYAVFEAICFNKEMKNEFTPSSFQKQKQELIRNDQFEQLLSQNLFHYHFQPIVSAKNGEIFAYEALMRSDDSIGLAPREILEIAERQNRLYEIERYTFFNILKFYKERFSKFQGKYLFINCLPSHLLTKEDFDLLYKKYHTLTHKVVVEASEIYVHTEEDHLLLTERLNIMGSQLALDDYGSGYGNELNLLKYNPKYIKIDRSLISNIDSDDKKRHLVSNIIQFAKLHGMISLAEGVETFKEMHTAIFLGVDLLQGFYLSRPTQEIIAELPKKKKEEIAAINFKYLKSNANTETFIADSNRELDMDVLIDDHYTSLVVNTSQLILRGHDYVKTKLSITIPDNSKTRLELDHVNIASIDGPCINIGRNSQVELILIGDNVLASQGIRVPESSKLSIIGNGNLTIRTDAPNSIGIGESPNHTFGSIRINITGKLVIHNAEESSICIGGGKGNTLSKIELISGQYALSTDGVIAIGVGCIDGQANIDLGKITMNILSNGTYSLGIGCLNGKLNLTSYADLGMKLTGQNSCCIGVLSNQKGNIFLQDGTVKLKLNARDGCAIGSLNGSIYIKIALQECICLIQGIHMGGIGNYAGTGVTEIQKGTISIKLAAAYKFYLGSQNGPLIIHGGNINCPINRASKPINKYRNYLRHYKFTDRTTFTEHIEMDNSSYDYEAHTTDYVKEINVYLPETAEYEKYLCK